METKVENRKTRVGKPKLNWWKDRQGQQIKLTQVPSLVFAIMSCMIMPLN
jgi:hypothetical protein